MKYRFIILIPHRDILKPFGEFRQKLFAEGFPGAHSFPTAAPLAEVSRPFSREELKDLAGNIRKLTMENDGKIRNSGIAVAGCPDKLSFFGAVLDLPVNENLFPQSAKNKILHTFFRPVLCAALVPSDVDSAGESQIQEKAPALSFRAASLANMVIRPLNAGDCGLKTGGLKTGDYSFEWKIGPPVWLPKWKGNKVF